MTDNRLGDSSGRRAARWTRAEAVKNQWQQGAPPDALAVLRTDPDLGADKQIVLDLAYEEYCLQEAAGRAPPVEDFAAQFPAHRQSLLRLLAVHSFLNAHPNALKLPDVRWPSPGDTLAEFTVVRPLGRGGFAHVYLARETTAGNRAVVLKVSADGLEEANTLGPLSHPHVMRVLAARRIGDLSVLVMPFLGAATLEDVAQARPADSEQLLAACAAAVEPADPAVMESCPSPFPAAVRFDRAVATIGRAVADALAFLHARDLAHQDLKPSNVLLTPTGFPVLLDFNLTTRAGPSHGSVGGTVPYMAPEQLVAFCSPGTTPTYDRAAADVYSLGVILYELLGGRHPFPGPSRNLAVPSRETVEARHQPPAPLASLNPAVAPALAAVVTACLAADAKQRPTARDVATQLRNIVEPPPPRTRRAPWLASLGLAGAAVVGLAVYFSRAETQQQPTAASSSAPSTPFERGLILLSEEKYAFAGKEFQDAAEANNDGRAYAYAAYCYAKCVSYESGVVCSDKAIKLGFNEAWVFTNRAYCHMRRSRPREANEDCTAGLALQPDCVEARFIRAQLALTQFHLDAKRIPDLQAIEDINLVRRKGPPAPEVSIVSALLYTARGDREALSQAVEAIREAVGRGASPDRIRLDPLLMGVLGNRDDLKNALNTSAGSTTPTKPPGLMQPR